MKIYRDHSHGRTVVQFGPYETARSERMEGWPIWAAFRMGENGVYHLIRIGETKKHPFSLNCSGAFCIIVPYITNSGRHIYTFVDIETGEVSQVDTSDEGSLTKARRKALVRAFLHHIPVVGGGFAWEKDVIIYDPQSNETEMIEVEL